MNKTWLKGCLFSIAALVSATATAYEDIHSIRIFQTNNQFVLPDARLPTSVTVRVYEVDTHKRASAEITRQVRARLSDDIKPGNHETANRKAFSDLLNSPDWMPIYQQIEAGGQAIDAAVRFQIEKVPAIVFNDRQVVYGQRSLQAAIEVYNKEERR